MVHIPQFVGFVAAQITNTILFYLILTRAEKLFGSYRYVMMVFTIYSLLYSWIEIITLPIIHIKSSMVVLMADNPLKYDMSIGNYISSLYSASYALCIYLLAAQFFYRYLALCRSLRPIRGYRLIIIFIPGFFVFIFWYFCVHFGMARTVAKQEILRDVILENYGRDTRNMSFTALQFWEIDKNGVRIWKTWEVLAYLGCFSNIISCFSVILFCASRIYKTLKKTSTLLCVRTRELNKQVFVTLSFQTILPLVILYCPVGIILTLPLFAIEVGQMGNIVSILAGIYPAIEPLIAMFFIKDFRKAVFCESRTFNIKI